MGLVVEAGHVVVGLRLEIRREEPAVGIGREKRQTPALGEIADQRRDENGLAGAGEPRHAKPQRRREKVRDPMARLSQAVGYGQGKVSGAQEGNLITVSLTKRRPGAPQGSAACGRRLAVEHDEHAGADHRQPHEDERRASQEFEHSSLHRP